MNITKPWHPSPEGSYFTVEIRCSNCQCHDVSVHRFQTSLTYDQAQREVDEMKGKLLKQHTCSNYRKVRRELA